ncbi:hypothetical protein GYMLUDRAFT_997125 [Collybiopsis luxurians FD-317 M1]|uniref:Uncharacterized protein n=1 Tax=Collybiopsis luxurians FD-317 M1 TaxID=944289 RepID=A0A0D0CYC4_9AGAR|nr:hypothetical protein GYMLUDRAFT_997125 [Collybiopsis luxurians FD-317 M1]
MAIEASQATWCFLPVSLVEDLDSEPPPFTYNTLHNLESSWWLLVYVLFNNDVTTDILQSHIAFARNRKSRSLFGRATQNYSPRNNFFRAPHDMTIAKTGISSTLTPTLRVVSTMANTSFCVYVEAEKPFCYIDKKN